MIAEINDLNMFSYYYKALLMRKHGKTLTRWEKEILNEMKKDLKENVKVEVHLEPVIRLITTK